MDLFFVKIKEADKNAGRVTLSKIQHKLGRRLLAHLLDKKYNIVDEILVENGKPHLKNNPIYFSISHSKFLVGIAFDKLPIGLDIEYKRKRDYKAILKYLNFDKEVSEDDFFQLWTTYEAEYKSGVKEDLMSFNYENYSVSISYSKKQEKDFNFYLIEEKNNEFFIKKVENPDILANLDYKLKP